MEIRLTREAKIYLLQAMKKGVINPEELEEVLGANKEDRAFYQQMVGELTEEERAVLLKVSDKVLERRFPSNIAHSV